MPVLDNMEYANDAAAQAAYVSNDSNAVKDSYSETYKDTSATLNIIHPSATSSYSVWGQAFTASSGFILTQAKFYLTKYSSPIGNAHARLYLATGTVGTNAVPTGNALASSVSYGVSTIPTNFTLITFDFKSDPYALQNGTDYCIVVEAPTSGTFNGTHAFGVGIDGSSPTHSGNSLAWRNSAWEAFGAHDACFYIYGINLQCYSESTIKQQGSYSLKAIAAQTDSLNDTLTRTIT